MREAYDRYSNISILLHWLIAGLLITNVLIAIAMHSDPAWFVWHKSIGIAVLLLTFVRILWRMTHPWPRFPDTMPNWERAASRTTHIAFYVLLLAVPLLGWAAVSAGRNGTGMLFGGIQWFDLPVGKSKELRDLFGDLHGWVVYGTLGLIAAHIGGALKHQFFDEDVVFHRMLPGLKQSHMDGEI